MNKLIFFCLMSLMVIYTHSTTCGSISTPTAQADCSAATEVPDDKVCTFVAATDSDPAKCDLVTKPKKSASSSTNSSDILNIFKITLALSIGLTILYYLIKIIKC